MLKSPVSYQGAKQRIAGQLIDIMQPTGLFYDLCCGSGAVSLELVNRGYDPRLIRMVDAGPWGLFWESIGRGTFLPSMMEYWCNQVPTDRGEIKEFMEALSKQPADYTTVPYVFLLLQAGSFGGKAIWIKDGRWQNCSCRSYWQPTATSSRRSPVNPMMPMPETLYRRVCEVASAMRCVQGGCVRVEDMVANVGPDATVYIDPPYDETTGYGHTLDVEAIIAQINAVTYVSEGRPVYGATKSFVMSAGRAKGGISGERKTANQEWLSVFEPTQKVA